jgi:hypothetical protein
MKRSLKVQHAAGVGVDSALTDRRLVMSPVMLMFVVRAANACTRSCCCIHPALAWVAAPGQHAQLLLHGCRDSRAAGGACCVKE